ncbi:lipid-binding SYLF domain-containing protein [Pedobacter sp. P351]|uniref:lipid-binding SYLF domain-containing protein n=1 Tax=Pedobacter superstes TaxID=3133441 RepID=UPI0030A7737D
MKTSKKIKSLVIVLLLSSISLFAQEKQDEKLQKSTAVLKAFAAMKENIPAQLMQKAEGIVVIPNLIKAGLGIGGQRGKGVAMIRRSDGSWSDPVFITLTGGSIGFQAGVQAIDLVMIFTKGSILRNLSNGEFTLGGDISVAAGPVGRSSSASTDTKLDAEVYSYSRSKGLFAGLTLNGSKLSPDKNANKAFYASNSNASAIFNKKASLNDANVIALKKAIRAFY